MPDRHPLRVALAVVITLLFVSGASAQGIELKSSAQVWSGSAATCSQPATVRFEALRDATPEWRTIRAEGVRKDSARYSLLWSQLNDRIRAACQKGAEDQARDCVVTEGDIKNANGLNVVDLTSEVVRRLESEQPAS